MRKTKQTTQNKKQKKQSVKNVPTPFRDTGGIVGNAIGQMFNNGAIGRNIGKWLGTGIGTIFGSGDYTLMGPSPSHNVLVNGAQIPKFHSDRVSNVVSHREFLRDVYGTTAFTLSTLPLNPGMSQTFPWLSNIAGNYQEYRILGAIFEFRSLVTDFVTGGSPGVIVMSTNYNADAPVFNTKQEMENAEYAVAVKPTQNLMHGIECDPAQNVLSKRYIRAGSIPSNQDFKTYDLGNFQIATQGNPVQLLGELWVSYVVELSKPLLPKDVSGTAIGGHAQRSGVATATPLGTTLISSVGTLALVTYLNGVSFLGQPGNVYTITFAWEWVSAVAATNPAVTLTTNLAFLSSPYYANGTNAIATAAGGFASYMMYQAVYRCTATTPSTCVVELATTGGVFGATVVCDIIVENSDSSYL